jgi:hypothetical protein
MVPPNEDTSTAFASSNSKIDVAKSVAKGETSENVLRSRIVTHLTALLVIALHHPSPLPPPSSAVHPSPIDPAKPSLSTYHHDK